MYHHQNSLEYFTVRAVRPLKATYGGKSLWSSGLLAGRKTEVRTIRLCLEYLAEVRGRYQLYVGIDAFIPKRMWDTSKCGLIYTDNRWEREFRAGLKLAFPVMKAVQGVWYTEQGRQGDNYVSLEGVICGKKKIRDFTDALGADDILDDMLVECEEDEERGFK